MRNVSTSYHKTAHFIDLSTVMSARVEYTENWFYMMYPKISFSQTINKKIYKFVICKIK